MSVSAVVVAAGEGKRFKSKTGKLLSRLGAKPVLVHSLVTLNNHPLVKDIVVVASLKNRNAVIANIKKYRIKKACLVVLGGKRRQDSVFNGMLAVRPDTGFVLVHDAARPLANSKSISAVIKQAMRTGAAILGVPVKATIKTVRRTAYSVRRTGKEKTKTGHNRYIKQTLDRSQLWEAQTPQVFRKKLLLRAYDKYAGCDVTDDAMLIERLGVKIALVMGSYKNIKITTIEDLKVAEALLKIRPGL